MDFWQLLKFILFGLTPLSGEAAVGVKDMERAIAWYCEVFDLVARRDGEKEVTLGYPLGRYGSIAPLITLIQIPTVAFEAAVEHHPVLFTKNLGKARGDLIFKRVHPGPIQEDSGGNHFFAFQDIEGNRIEVCLEPGKKFS